MLTTGLRSIRGIFLEKPVFKPLTKADIEEGRSNLFHWRQDVVQAVRR